MQKPVKKYFNDLLDADSAEHLVPPNKFISGHDFRIGTTDKGGVGYIENILKNAEKSHTLPSGGTNTRIGFAASDEEGWIVKFNHNSIGDHGIYLFDIVSETWYDLLLEADVTGGLNFERNQLIHSTRIENGILYWCNGTLNEPRKLNIRAAANMSLGSPEPFPGTDAYTSPLSQNVLYWIRRQPGLPPSQTKMTGSPVVNNFIKDEGFWFCYRYIYRDYEISTLSGLSTLANYNTKDEDYNFIYIEIPFEEKIEQDVLQVDLVVKYANSGKRFVIKSWNKNVPADLAAINAHNSVSPGVALNFDYYNDFIGIALDDAYSVKPYDSLPIYAQTIEIARNRAFMANYTIGYDTPITTSLAAEFTVRTEGASITAIWFEVSYPSCGAVPSSYGLKVSGTGSVYDGYYAVNPSTLWLTSSVDWSNMTFIVGLSGNPAIYYGVGCVISGYPVYGTVTEYPSITASITSAPFVTSLSGLNCFKSDAPYQIGIVFYDFAGRKCGIFTSNDLIYTTPDKTYSSLVFSTELNWTLSYVNEVAEIPIWAYYYSIVITKCLRTRYFLESRVKNLTYATKDSDGVYIFNTSAYAANLNGVAIDITLLNSQGMGYTFADGDVVKIYKGTNVFTLSIVAQEGNWIICELQDLGTIGNTASPYLTALFEIYTPYRRSIDEPHYEVAETFPIIDPATVNRAYSTLGGTIGGDVYILTRNDGSADYLTENMSPNDKFYTRWNTDSGRPNFLDTIGQVAKTNDIAYSDVLIQGTKTNGLSTFEALNTKDVPVECGDITKLESAEKITEQGSVMLALCVNETVSLYLGEVQLLGTSQNAFLAQSADVIGTINILQGSFGTMNPESVVKHGGRVFFYCLISGCFVEYATNGLRSISDFGLKRVSHLFSQKYASLSQAEIEALGSRPFVFGGIDPYHEEVYWSIPKVEATPPKGYLEDYVSPDLPIIYPYDIYDGLAKVLVYKINADQWGAPHSYETEGFINIRDFLFSATNGAMYKHNVDNGTANTYSEWYGVSATPAIAFIINEEPNIVKEFITLSVEGNTQPTFVHARTETPNIQSTDIRFDTDTEWIRREGVFYAKYGIRRDRLSPNVSGSYDAKVFTGDKMRGNWLKVFIEFETSSLMQVRFFNIGYLIHERGNT